LETQEISGGGSERDCSETDRENMDWVNLCHDWISWMVSILEQYEPLGSVIRMFFYPEDVGSMVL
jgi:hypothetical protein